MRGFGQLYDTGANANAADARVKHILDIRSDIATLDLNTMVFGGEVVINTLPSIRRVAQLIQSVGVRPEIELREDRP